MIFVYDKFSDELPVTGSGYDSHFINEILEPHGWRSFDSTIPARDDQYFMASLDGGCHRSVSIHVLHAHQTQLTTGGSIRHFHGWGGDKWNREEPVPMPPEKSARWALLGTWLRTCVRRIGLAIVTLTKQIGHAI